MTEGAVRTRQLIGAILLLGAAGCGQGSGTAALAGPAAGGAPSTLGADTVSAVVGTPFDLRVGQFANIGAAATIIQLVDVRQDNRCPVGAQCPTAGNAQIALNLRGSDGATSQVVLNLTGDAQFPSSTAIGGHTLRFQGLNPAPQVNVSIQRSQYVATFTATRP
jgi:hypothetical protein